jgi:hypothetical protein
MCPTGLSVNSQPSLFRNSFGSRRACMPAGRVLGGCQSRRGYRVVGGCSADTGRIPRTSPLSRNAIRHLSPGGTPADVWRVLTIRHPPYILYKSMAEGGCRRAGRYATENYTQDFCAWVEGRVCHFLVIPRGCSPLHRPMLTMTDCHKWYHEHEQMGA